MFIGNYFQIIFDLLTIILILFRSFYSTTNLTALKPAYKYSNTILILFVIALMYANLIGFRQKKSFDNIYIDNLRILSFSLILIIPLLFFRLSNKILKILNTLFFIFTLIYTTFVFINILVSRNISEEDTSIFPGNLFSISTLNLTLISYFCYYYLFRFILKQNILDAIFIFISYLIILFTLQKWNIVCLVTIPIIFIKFVLFSKSVNKKVLNKIILLNTFIFILIFASVGSTFIAQKAGFDDIGSFMDSRVLTKTDAANSNGLEQGVVGVNDSQAIKDGGRLLMWGDMVTRSFEHPFIGIGFGSRALEQFAFNIEDHNMIITFMSRFGFPMTFIILYFLFKYIKSLYNIQKVSNNLFKYILLFCILNFFFQSIVGNIWGQSFITINFSIILGLILSSIKLKSI